MHQPQRLPENLHGLRLPPLRRLQGRRTTDLQLGHQFTLRLHLDMAPLRFTVASFPGGVHIVRDRREYRRGLSSLSLSWVDGVWHCVRLTDVRGPNHQDHRGLIANVHQNFDRLRQALPDRQPTTWNWRQQPRKQRQAFPNQQVTAWNKLSEQKRWHQAPLPKQQLQVSARSRQ